MRNQNRVLWKEGLFIQPQHFQQQQRHIDYLIGNQLTKFNNTYNFGFQKLEFESRNVKSWENFFAISNGRFSRWNIL